MASFLYSREGDGTRRDGMCGVMRFEDAKGRELHDLVKRSAEEVSYPTLTIDGLAGYQDFLWGELGAFADSRTLLWGSDEEAFRAYS